MKNDYRFYKKIFSLLAFFQRFSRSPFDLVIRQLSAKHLLEWIDMNSGTRNDDSKWNFRIFCLSESLEDFLLKSTKFKCTQLNTRNSKTIFPLLIFMKTWKITKKDEFWSLWSKSLGYKVIYLKQPEYSTRTEAEKSLHSVGSSFKVTVNTGALLIRPNGIFNVYHWLCWRHSTRPCTYSTIWGIRRWAQSD